MPILTVLYIIGSLLDILNENSKEHVELKKHSSLDERMIAKHCVQHFSGVLYDLDIGTQQFVAVMAF